MAFLFISNIQTYLSVNTSTDVALDETGEAHMRIFFNITMERLPCQFASVDVEDVMGTSVTNVTKEILKFKVAPDSGHRQEFYPEQPRDIEHEVLTPEEEQFPWRCPTSCPARRQGLRALRETSDLVLVAFGAVVPVVAAARARLAEDVERGEDEAVRPARARGARRLHRAERAADVPQAPHPRVPDDPRLPPQAAPLTRTTSATATRRRSSRSSRRRCRSTCRRRRALAKDANALAPSKTEDHSLQGEGCQLTGSLSISRVPGNFRISARSDSHSFNTRVMNVSHHVDKLVFGAMVETGRLRHVMPIKERSSLFGVSFMMHQELATLKHYLKVVPYHYTFVDGETHHTYMYKANYNEYRPRKLEWYEGKADAHVDTQLVRRPPTLPLLPPPTLHASDACVARLRQVPNAVFTMTSARDGGGERGDRRSPRSSPRSTPSSAASTPSSASSTTRYTTRGAR